jgi:Sec-independent protein translocase protein TatA
MDILGIGPFEFIIIFLIILLVLGPKDMVKTGRTIGVFLRKVFTSQEWRTIQQAAREIRNMPNKIVREAGLEEIQKSIPDMKTIGQEMGSDNIQKDIQEWQKDVNSELSPWITPPAPKNPPAPSQDTATPEDSQPLSKSQPEQ